ncbi:MAG: hypothetical protein HRU26_01430 [Psychroserpens sp.]|nr:hypothetical protein [Psychroserpens sp.]
MKEYQCINGTSYDVKTPKKLIEVLERCRNERIRVVLDYGDTKTGKSWGEMHDITGYVSRTTGSTKIPILVYNRRCLGGGAILDHCIISVKTSKGKIELYNINK